MPVSVAWEPSLPISLFQASTPSLPSPENPWQTTCSVNPPALAGHCLCSCCPVLLPIFDFRLKICQRRDLCEHFTSRKEIHRPLILSEMKSCVLRLKYGHDVHLDNGVFIRLVILIDFLFSNWRLQSDIRNIAPRGTKETVHTELLLLSALPLLLLFSF